MLIYTIGHSNHDLEKFIKLVNDNSIVVLVDVRSAPYSRYKPHFNKDSLEFELPRHSIQYFYAGKYLGGRPTDPSLYKSRKLPSEDNYLQEVDYLEIMKRPWFKNAIDQLVKLADQEVIAIMCSEEDPAQCHRHHLIAKYLMKTYPEVDVQHIRADGMVYGAHTILKSVDKPKAGQERLF